MFDLTRLAPSRNTEERLQSNMPIDRAYISGRIGSIYSALADCGIFVERMHTHEDWKWLQTELRAIEAAIGTVRRDLASKEMSLP